MLGPVGPFFPPGPAPSDSLFSPEVADHGLTPACWDLVGNTLPACSHPPPDLPWAGSSEASLWSSSETRGPPGSSLAPWGLALRSQGDDVFLRVSLQPPWGPCQGKVMIKGRVSKSCLLVRGPWCECTPTTPARPGPGLLLESLSPAPLNLSLLISEIRSPDWLQFSVNCE